MTSLKRLLVPTIFSTIAILALFCLSVAGEGPSEEDSRVDTSRGAQFNVYVSEPNDTRTLNKTTYVAFYSISIENIGDSLGDVTMYMSGFPSTDWDWQPNPGGADHKIESVWPGEVKWISLVIYGPLDERAGEYNLYLEVKPGGPSSEVMLKSIIPQKGGIELIAPASVETEPGNRIELVFQIGNTGNGEDTFTIARIDLGKPTWDAELVGGYQTGKVKPGRTTNKILRITVPYEADATRPDKHGVRVSLTVHSDFDPDQEDGRGTYIKVLQFWAITFNVNKIHATARPGDLIAFRFIIRNDGNGQDNISLGLLHNLDDWSLGLSQSHFNLSKDIGRQAVLTVIPSEDTVRGDYWIDVIATSTGPSESPDVESQTLLITIEEVFNVTMDIETDTAPPMPPGGVAEYSFTVTNNGNTNDYVTLEVTDVPMGWFVTLDNEGVPLGPGQTKTLSLTILASPRLEESPAKKYYFSVTGTSDGSPRIINLINVMFEVEPVGKIDLTISGDDTLSVNPYQKENYNFIFDVINKGNCIDEMVLTVSSTSWDPATVKINPVLYPSIMSVPFHTLKQGRLEVTVPRGTPLGYYDITVMAKSTLNPESTKSIVVHVKVVQDDVTIQPIKFKKNSELDYRIWKQYRVEYGNVIYIGVPVSNNGSEVVQKINLKVYQDSKVIREENITSLGLLKTVVITVQWEANHLGTYKIKAVANIKGDSNVKDNVATAEIKVVESMTTTDGQMDTRLRLEPGSPLFMVLIVVIIIGILTTVRYMMSLRAEQSTRDLYESIYAEEIERKEGKDFNGQYGRTEYYEYDR